MPKILVDKTTLAPYEKCHQGAWKSLLKLTKKQKGNENQANPRNVVVFIRTDSPIEEKGEILWTPSYRRSIEFRVAGCFSSAAESIALALDVKQFWLRNAQSEPPRESSLVLAVPFEEPVLNLNTHSLQLPDVVFQTGHHDYVHQFG
ncbi:hypothetical protein OUZ56_018723 [Daphnia magna]|uniref:Uncharacterized protein n=1 Tax=Daphnia magna TaxID=35525 RepID=A0ABQ9Z9K7_9CRUS|nr:hypothetical protein OUZ56_018723 [Daphnia magna]